MNSKVWITAIATMTTLYSIDCYADPQRVDFDFDASAGLEHDSNVGLVELDNNSGEADSATLLAAGLNVTLAMSKQTSLRVGYDYSDTSYQQYSDFDLALHHAVAELAYSGRHIDLAVAADRYEGVLDGEDYLTLTQYSPSMSKLIGSRLFVRGAYIAASKEYDLLDTRNAESDAARLDTYWLFDGMNRYLSLGLQKIAEDAVDPELTYDGMQAAIAYGHTVKFPLMRLQLKAQLRYEQRDYANVTQSINARRDDQRLRGSLVASIPFTDYLEVEATVEHTDNESNLDSASIDKMVYGLGLAVRF